VLPFDLHVLGLPPAFTLSQDQTLHLKHQGRSPIFRVQSSSQPNLLTAFACFELTWFCYERLQDGQLHLPDARTSHLRTLSKISRFGLSASPRPRSFPSEGAAHYRVVFVAVNTPCRSFFRRPGGRAGPPCRGSQSINGPGGGSTPPPHSGHGGWPLQPNRHPGASPTGGSQAWTAGHRCAAPGTAPPLSPGRRTPRG
jgi:hypothetical protein